MPAKAGNWRPLKEGPTLVRRIGRDGEIIPESRLERSPKGEWEIEVAFTPMGGRLYPWRVELRPDIFEDDLPAGGITARLLRSVRLGALIDEFRREQLGRQAAEELFFRRRTRRTPLPPPANRPGPRGWSEAFYQDVAVDYLRASADEPRSPIQRLAKAHPRYRAANVRDWVARARALGYLTKPGHGRAGGEGTDKLWQALRARKRARRRE